jgi:hypothetical protein
MFVFFFRNNHAPQGEYYLVAADRDEVMKECDLAGYMVYEKRVPLHVVADCIDQIPTQNRGNYYASMATAVIHTAPHVCKQCVNRICGRLAGDQCVPVVAPTPLKNKYRKLTRYPGIAGEEVDDDTV